jgi:cell wall assembly regulator SMI1
LTIRNDLPFNLTAGGTAAANTVHSRLQGVEVSVTQEWSKLLAALDTLSDRALTFLPPTPATEVAAAEAATDAEWPQQLREFYTLHNGQDPNDRGRFHGELLPQSWFFSVDYVVEQYQMMVEHGRWELENDQWLRDNARDSEAGSTAHCFLPSYIPIGGLDSYYYFIDTRPGPHSGCIRHWTRDDGDNGSGPIWDSITDMLAAVRESVSTDAPLYEPWRPWFIHDPEHPDHGTLTWETTFSTDLADAPAPVPDPVPLHLPFPILDFRPSEVGPDDDCVDLESVRQSVLAVARRLHPGADIVGGAMVYQRVPRRQGITANSMTHVNGELTVYLTVVTGIGNRVLVHEHPPGGFTVITPD